MSRRGCWPSWSFAAGRLFDKMIVAERQREQRVESVRIRRGVARHVKQLEKELPDIDNDIDTLVRGSPAWRDKEELLISFPGVSNTLARLFIAEVPELGTALIGARSQALAGLAPFIRQSGRWKGRSKIGGGRSALRAGL